MYITRRLSEYRRNPSELTQPPPEGPSSGVLVIHDQHSQILSSYVLLWLVGGDDSTNDPIMFIPVLDKPMSSNCYYAIRRRGKHSGEASTSAKEEDIVSCCLCLTQVPEAKPKQLDPYDIYQQFEIHQKKPSSRYYHGTSVAPDGVPPWFLKKKEWTVVYSEWYVPFIFVKERDAKDQIKRSVYYSMTLEQRWEEVFFHENDKSENHDVVVDVEVEDKVVKLEGQETTREERFGWTSKVDQERAMVVKRLEKPKDGSFWKSYHCYVLIESFVLKRMDESLVLTYEFRHVDKVKSKWSKLVGAT
ncbi:hypothetical protein Rs2_18489 [Raphanus sativus]|nr:hypothetical protein Rs2_18489 [Raphanus sativus]